MLVMEMELARGVAGLTDLSGDGAGLGAGKGMILAVRTLGSVATAGAEGWSMG